MSRVDAFAALPEEAKSIELWRMLELMSEPIIVESLPLPEEGPPTYR